jgi:hypothetical protein
MPVMEGDDAMKLPAFTFAQQRFERITRSFEQHLAERIHQ